jgi:DNA-binding transcriptional regulator YdaS (Cro superfamily)
MKKKSPLWHWRQIKGVSQAELGKLLGVQDAAVTKWEKGRVPAERVLSVSKVTGIPAHQIRPDLYPAPTKERREAGATA